ncbi:MAG: flagellar protein FlaG [Spirochaetes bacterium]|nr:MAG: flagellar protein FlaG [Spirochaetota bacterium]
MEINKVLTKVVENPAQTRMSPVRPDKERHAYEREESAADPKFSGDQLSDIVDTLNSAAKSVNRTVSFSIHEKTKSVIMRFQDSSTHEVVREIPSREMLRLLEHMRELIGMFVDEAR